MKFRLRQGFNWFHSVDESVEHSLGNRAIIPRASSGDVLEFRLDDLQAFKRAGTLGRLEPIDAAAVAFFGNTKPIESRATLNPLAYVPHERERTT